MVFERVKVLLGLQFDISPDDVLNEIIANFTEAVKVYCGTETLPQELEFVVVEATVARYLRIGSEGIKDETFGDVSISYIEDILQPYITYLDNYKKYNVNQVKFL